MPARGYTSVGCERKTITLSSGPRHDLPILDPLAFLVDLIAVYGRAPVKLPAPAVGLGTEVIALLYPVPIIIDPVPARIHVSQPAVGNAV